MYEYLHPNSQEAINSRAVWYNKISSLSFQNRSDVAKATLMRDNAQTKPAVATPNIEGVVLCFTYEYVILSYYIFNLYIDVME